ncbi:hypothetical protein PG999_003089 [Apiospora kogelbergensis]|uniref:Amidase domain-containing protein n=1 Tax=Apiospora kogelbergensis TaxID=1337665 RepID=A0AAW0R9Z7_9PEZI
MSKRVKLDVEEATFQDTVHRTVSSGSRSITTTIINVDGKPYLLHAEDIATLEQTFQHCEFLPATYFGDDIATGTDATAEMLAKLAEDDVWSPGFMSLAIYPSNDPKGKQPVQPELSNALVVHVLGGLAIPPGPYAVHAATGNLYPVSRLMPDPSNAFIRGIVPNSYKVPFNRLQLIPVPSRAYSGKPTRKSPLSGLRFGVKDNINISGLQTGNGSEDYRSLYPPPDETAPCIQLLLDAGAVLVGKLRCTQWCDGQDPLERFEEVTPTNPRGDGWQKPSSSSSGSASACASYAWLDFTVGSDTGGSIRHPAGVNGLFGIRPSLNAINTFGTLVCFREFDTIGIFTRSASVASSVGKVMMDGVDGDIWRVAEEVEGLMAEEKKRWKFKLLYAVEPSSEAPTSAPKFFPHPDAAPLESQIPAANIFEIFLSRLEAHLDVQRQVVDLYSRWRETRPDPESTDADLAKYTANMYPNLVYGSMAYDEYLDFVHDFQSRRPGRGRPFVEPTTRARLEYGADVTDEAMERARDVLDVFGTWVKTELLPAPARRGTRGDEDQDAGGPEKTAVQEIPLLVYPQAWGRPQYRDEVARREPGKLFWEGFSVYSLSYGSGCPDYVVPLGEVEFTSRVTGASAHLPVAISLLVPRGMDEVLLGLIAELEEVGILREVAAGDRLFR